MLKGYYRNFANQIKDADFNASLHTATGNTQTGNYNGTLDSCAYAYNSGKYAHGSVYVVSGSSGKLDKVTRSGYPHDCMHYSNIDDGGCFYFEVDSNRLDAKFISFATANPSVPIVRDSFTVFKDVNNIREIAVLKDSPLVLSASWRGTYVWPNNGNAVTQSVAPSTAVAGNFNYVVRDNYSCIKDSFYVTVISPDVRLCMPSSNGTILSNISGNSYQWQVNNGNGYVNISDGANYTGSATNQLQLTNVPSAYTGNLYRCVVDGQNGWVFELRFVNIWLGTISSAWETAGNWSCGVLPDENTDVIINSGTPVLSSNTYIRSIKVSEGAKFTVAENFSFTESEWLHMEMV